MYWYQSFVFRYNTCFSGNSDSCCSNVCSIGDNLPTNIVPTLQKHFRHMQVFVSFLQVYKHVHNWIVGAERLKETCKLNEHGYVPLVVNTSRSFPNSSLMTGFVTRFLVSVIKCFVFQLDFQLKAAFAVVPTDNICGRSLSLKIPFDMNSIILKLYVTWLTWPRNLYFRGDFCRF